MNKKILAIVTAVPMALSGWMTANAQEEEDAPPYVTPVDTFTCHYNEGKGAGDLDKAIANWNAWMDTQGADDYAAFTLTPYYYGADTFDIGGDLPALAYTDGHQVSPIELPRAARVHEQALKLGTEQQPAAGLSIVQRLYAQAISRQENAFFAKVGNGEGKHAVEMLEHVDAHLVVEMDEHFRIAIGAEAMPFGLQLTPQLSVIIDFAIEGDDGRAIGAHHGLIAIFEINDLQSPHAHSKAADAVGAPSVWSTVENGIAHRRE